MAKIKFGSSWKVQSPCAGCTVRELGCHGKCDKYAEYQQKLFDFKKKVLSTRDKEAVVTSYITNEKIKNAHAKVWER